MATWTTAGDETASLLGFMALAAAPAAPAPSTDKVEKKAPAPESKDGCVNVVVQRCNEASLLLDNDSQWSTVGRSMVVYISFARGATVASAQSAGKALCFLPLLTLGNWGDGSKPVSLVDILIDEANRIKQSASSVEAEAPPSDGTPLSRISVMVIPQASLSGKRDKKSLKYHGQLDKEEGKQVYAAFLSALQASSCEAVLEGRYKGDCRYKTLDKRGVPQSDSEGKPLSQSVRKCVDKQYRDSKAALQALDSARQENWLLAVCSGPVGKGAPVKEEGEVLNVLAGTFGNRQGVKMDQESGPFTHTFVF